MVSDGDEQMNAVIARSKLKMPLVFGDPDQIECVRAINLAETLKSLMEQSEGRPLCSECDGTGEVQCDNCVGSGDCSCTQCGKDHKCGGCNGTGKMTCEECDGYKVEFPSPETMDTDAVATAISIIRWRQAIHVA